MKFSPLLIFTILVFNNLVGQTIVGSSFATNLVETKALIIFGGIGIQTFDNYKFDEDEQDENKRIEEKKYSLISFPNPSYDYITFSGNFDDSNNVTYKLQIFNVSGTLIKTIKRVSKDKQIDVSNLSEGFYLIKLTGLDKGEEENFKFIKYNR